MPALAQSTDSRVTVSHTDLDLTNSRDIARLDLRIAHAAKKACGSPSSIDLEGINELPRCWHKAVAEAGSQRDQLLGQAKLTH